MKLINVNEMGDAKRGICIGKKDTFNFMCHKDIACFNDCCKNLNMFLYPYDVLRLKNTLNQTSSKFIEDHVDLIFRKGNYFPDVLLRMKDDVNMSCPFLSNEGCSVYHDRPYTCRTFPIEQAILSKEISKSNNNMLNFFRPPKFCMGQNEAVKWTVETWSKNQDTEIHRKMTVHWSSVKRMFYVNPWGKDLSFNNIKFKMAFIAAYDIDKFNKFVFQSSFLKRHKISNKIIKKIKYNESDLLRLGFDWIKLFIWGIDSGIITNKL